MKHSISIALRAAITLLASSMTAALPVAAFASGPTSSLANTSWAGTVTFISGQNNGVVEQGAFRYQAGNTLTETTNGPVGDFTGTGTWIQGSGAVRPCLQLIAAAAHTLKSVPVPSFDVKKVTLSHIFSDHFVEPIAGTNLEVVVKECGIISPDNMAYDALSYGQLYEVTDGQATPVPNSDGYTIVAMARQ